MYTFYLSLFDGLVQTSGLEPPSSHAPDLSIKTVNYRAAEQQLAGDVDVFASICLKCANKKAKVLRPGSALIRG